VKSNTNAGRARRTISIFAALMMVLTGFGGLLGNAGAQDRPILRFGTNAADIASLDPHYASATQDRVIVDLIFNGLVRFKPGDSSTFEPDIATAVPEPVDAADGSQTWSFTLRDDVMCQASPSTDAYALTSADVLFSFEKAANADTSTYASNYAGYTFAAPDPQTFTVTLAAAISPTLFLPSMANYAGGYVICQQPYEALGADGFLANPVGTGPFAFESYAPQSNVSLVANDEFYRGAPKLGGVDVRFVADSTARELAIQSGDLDVIAGFPEAAWVDRLNEGGEVQVDVFGVGEAVFLNLNVEHEILKDPKVREAILLAINREDTVNLSGSPVSEPIYSIVPADFVPGGLTEEEATAAGVNYAQDIERAKALLVEAGYPEGFELDLVTSEQDSYRNAYTVLQEQLRGIGITVNLEPVQHATMHEQIRLDSNAITIYIAFRPTADVYLTQFFSTSGGTTNFSKFTLDELVAEARATTDPDAQAELWKQANTEILQNFAGYGLMYTNQVYARTAAVDYGHELVSVVQLYPGIDETTTITN